MAEYLEESGQRLEEAAPEPVSSPDDWTVAELALHYDEFASEHYLTPFSPAIWQSRKASFSGFAGFRIRDMSEDVGSVRGIPGFGAGRPGTGAGKPVNRCSDSLGV